MAGFKVYPDESVDDLLHGELKLIQKKKGFRYSVDALLLSHFVMPFCSKARIIDLGCGSGVIPLILAARSNPDEIVGVEIQAGLAGMAKRNVRLNNMEHRIKIIHRDMLKIYSLFPAGGFDLVVSNPPFIPKGAGRLSEGREKATARHEIRIDLERIIPLSAYLAGPRGRICFIYPVARLDEVKGRLASGGLSISRLQFAYDRRGGSPKLFCVEAVKRLVGEPRRLKPVYIETPEGKFAL